MVDRDCEIQTLCGAQFEGDHTDGLAFVVDKRPSTIARIDGGMGLQYVEAFTAIPYRTEDASGDGSFETPWTSDDDQWLPHCEEIGITQTQGGKIRASNLDNGKVTALVYRKH